MPGRTVESCRWMVLDAGALPGHVAQAVRRMMAAFELVYATFEFDVDSAGAWWLMELNRRGAFGEIQDRIGLPISAAIAQRSGQRIGLNP